MTHWRIYYDDGSHSDDEVTRPFRVICIAQPREKTGREVLHSVPYYYLKGGVWYGAEDQASMIQQMAYYAPEITAVCMGIFTDQRRFDAIIKEAIEDEGLPRRSAHDPDRRR